MVLNNYFKFILFLIIALSFQSWNAYSQCPQKIEVKRLLNADRKSFSGQVELTVHTQGTFKVQLMQITSASQTMIKSFSGSGTKLFSLNNDLIKGNYYRVVVEFDKEERFLCKRKVEDIDLTDIE